MVVPAYIPTNSAGGFPFLHTPSSPCYLWTYNDGHSDGCEFDKLHLMVSRNLGNSLFRSFAHFSIGLLAFLLLSCISRLYVLEMKPLSVASFETTFSHSVSCIFVFFLVSFAVQNLVSLIRPHRFIFAYISVALGD